MLTHEHKGRKYFIVKGKENRDKGRIVRLNKTENVFDFDVLKDKHRGEIGFVIAPGSSLNALDLSYFDDKLTFGVNSAGFVLNLSYWVLDEGRYAKHLGAEADSIPEKHNRIFAGSLRAAMRLSRLQKEKEIYKRMYVVRLAEQGFFPAGFDAEAKSTLNAIGLANWTGCSKIYIFGLDFGGRKGAYYVKGIPPKFIPTTHKNQIATFKKFDFKGMDITSVNDLDRKMSFPTISIKEYFDALE